MLARVLVECTPRDGIGEVFKLVIHCPSSTLGQLYSLIALDFQSRIKFVG